MVIEVSLRILGDSLSPDDVTEALNIEPTRSHFKGDETLSSKGKKRVMKSGYWELDAREKHDSMQLIDHLNYLLKIIKACNQDIKSLAGCQSVEFSIILGTANDNTIEFALDSEILKQIVEIGVDLHFTII